MNSQAFCPGELGHRSLRLKRACMHTVRQVLVNNPLFPVPIDGFFIHLPIDLLIHHLLGRQDAIRRRTGWI